MIKKIEILKKVEVEKELICNKCGKKEVLDLDADVEMLSEIEKINSFHSIRLKPGYGSIFDGEKISFELCDSCLQELLGSFKVKSC